jgi:hypothetical protein
MRGAGELGSWVAVEPAQTRIHGSLKRAGLALSHTGW